jgi:hypothetical protein
MLLNGSEAASEEFDAPTEQLRNHDFRNSRITNSAERVMISFACIHLAMRAFFILCQIFS